jgi:hypothetical protein
MIPFLTPALSVGFSVLCAVVSLGMVALETWAVRAGRPVRSWRPFWIGGAVAWAAFAAGQFIRLAWF